MTVRNKVDRLKRLLRITREGSRCPECGRVGPEERGAMGVPNEAKSDERAELLALFNHILDVAQRAGCRETFCRCGRQRLNSALFMRHCAAETWDAIEAVNRRIYHRMGRQTPFEIACADVPPVGDPLHAPDGLSLPGGYQDS